jgi:spermidine/putrescine-binding protein
VGSIVGGCGGNRSKGEVVVITWAGADKAKLLGAAFEKKTGIKLRLIPGEGDADFYNKIKAGGGDQYDVVISNVGFTPLYRRAGLIELLDLNDFSAADELYPEFRTDMRFDYLEAPNRAWAFPHQWGSYAMTYNTQVPFQPRKPISWEELWRAPRGRVMLDGFNVTNIALAGRMTGATWDEAFSLSGSALDEATQRLIDLKPFRLATAETTAINDFRSKRVVIGMIFSLGFGSTVNRKVGSEVARSVIPTEGVLGALDGVMLVKDARNRDNALEFIDFEGGRAAQTIFWDLYRGPTANRVATEAIIDRGGLDAELMRAQHGDKPEIATQLVQLRQPDDAAAWDDAWDRVLAA